MEPLLAGSALGDVPWDDLRYVEDLGLVRRENGAGYVVANPIYQEVIPRALSYAPSVSLPRLEPRWLRPDGSLDESALLEAFVAFWRRHGEPLLGAAPYHEIAPHLVLMAFLDRVANGGGTVDREYAIGSGRMDLLLSWHEQRLALELKVWRDHQRDPLDEGLEQLDTYLAGLGLRSGWLVIFDRRSDLPPLGERVTTRSATSPGGRHVEVIRG
jgi:hypothetical protein